MQLSKETLLVFFVIRIMIWTKPGHCLENDDDHTSNCSLQLKKASIPEEIDKFIEDSKQVIKLDFNVDKDNGPFSLSSTEQHDLLKPYSLVLALDPVGKSLLHLKENLIPMSLYTLGYGVARITVDLIQSPPDCLRDLLAEDLEKELKLLIFRNFGNTTSTALSEGEICNQHVQATEDGSGIVRYSCCKLVVGDNLECLDLEETVWINMLFATIVILQVVLVLYSPSFVPSSSRMKSCQKYIYKPTEPMDLKVTKVLPNAVITDTKFAETEYLKPLKDALKAATMVNPKCITNNQTVLNNEGVVYSFNVQSVTFDVKANKILPDSPITFVKFLKRFFLQLNMRNEHELSELQTCCKTKIFEFNHCCRWLKSKEYTWYKCLTPFMWLIAMLVLMSPWLFRVWFFYAFEEEDRDILINQLNKKGLRLPFSGSFVLYFTPAHTFFLLIYSIVLVFTCFFYFLCDNVKTRLKHSIRVSLKRMHERKKFDDFVTFIAHCLYPFDKCGYLGIIIFPFWLVIMSLGLIILGFCIFPLANLTLRLLINIFHNVFNCSRNCITNRQANQMNSKVYTVYKSLMKWYWSMTVDKQTKDNIKLAVAISQVFMFIFIFSFCVLVVECISFYVEFVIYIIIGIILNSDYVMKFLTLAVMIALHAYYCFSSVGKTYECFAKAVNSAIQKKVDERDLDEAAMQSEDIQQRQAFAVPAQKSKSKQKINFQTANAQTSETVESMRCYADMADEDKKLKWEAKRLVLFLDKDDTPYLPSTLFYKIAKMGHSFCPKPVYFMYFRALIELLWIMLFLGFVMLVVFAIGDARIISKTNQTLAISASGLLTFAFRKLLITPSEVKVDDGNLGWKAKLAGKINHHTSFWAVKHLEFDSKDQAPRLRNDIDLNNIPGDVQILVNDNHMWVRKIPQAEKCTCNKKIYLRKPKKVGCNV